MFLNFPNFKYILKKTANTQIKHLLTYDILQKKENETGNVIYFNFFFKANNFKNLKRSRLNNQLPIRINFIYIFYKNTAVYFER